MQDENLDWIKEQEYEYGFETSIEADVFLKVSMKILLENKCYKR